MCYYDKEKLRGKRKKCSIKHKNVANGDEF